MAAYVRGEAPLTAWKAMEQSDRVALLAFFTAGDRSKQLIFHNVRTPLLLLKVNSLRLSGFPSAHPHPLLALQVQVDSLAPYAQHQVRDPTQGLALITNTGNPQEHPPCARMPGLVHQL